MGTYLDSPKFIWGGESQRGSSMVWSKLGPGAGEPLKRHDPVTSIINLWLCLLPYKAGHGKWTGNWKVVKLTLPVAQ